MRKGNQSSRACSLCRQKRTKCSGTQPCDRCVAHHEECNFQQQAYESKASLRAKIKELKKKEHDSQAIFGALRSGNGSRAVLSALQQNVPIDDIASALSDPNSAWALAGDETAPESTTPSFLGQPGQAPSELDTIANTSAGLDESPVSSTATDSSSWVLSQGAIPDTSGLLPNGLPGNVLTQVAPNYRHFYNGDIHGEHVPSMQGPAYGASEGLMPQAQWANPFGFDPLAGGDSMDAHERGDSSNNNNNN